jgi:hypothetical protein
MRILTVTVIVLLIASTSGAQAPASNLPPADSQSQTPMPAQPPASSAQIIVVPEGTRIPATLSSPISNKVARPGTPVRAVTSFPVTVGGVVAIPVGTYMEGVIDKVTRNRRTGDTMEMHFTRIVYANGYTVSIDGVNTNAKLVDPQSDFVRPAAYTSDDQPRLVLAAQQAPQPPPLQHPGEGAAIGVGVGAAAAVIIAIIVFGHRGGASNGVLFDTGWQFEMVLQAPLSIDAASATAAAATTSGA